MDSAPPPRYTCLLSLSSNLSALLRSLGHNFYQAVSSRQYSFRPNNLSFFPRFSDVVFTTFNVLGEYS